MSKGRRPKVSRGREPVLTVREPIEGEQSIVCETPDKLKCWEFFLVDLQPTVKSVGVGEPVLGIIRNGQVAVSAAIGLLGFAPTGTAQKIVQAGSQQHSDHLQGSVTEKIGEAKLKVRLCLE